MEECGSDVRSWCEDTWRFGKKREKRPFELDVEHVLRRKAHGEMLELRGIWWGGRRHARSDDGSKR